MAEGELASVAIDQIQTDGQDDVNANAKKDIQVIGIDEARPKREQKTGHNSPQQQKLLFHQTFSISPLPSSPDGLKRRIKIKIANEMASR